MENKTFQIVNLPGLSGLHCVAHYAKDVDLYSVEELINVGIVIGDRLLRYPIPTGAMWLAREFLEEVEPISSREFSADNPFGEFKYEGRFEKDKLAIVHAVYDNAISITIYEMINDKQKEFQRTLYTGNFFEQKQVAIEIIDELLHGRMEPEDVIFELKSLEDK